MRPVDLYDECERGIAQARQHWSMRRRIALWYSDPIITWHNGPTFIHHRAVTTSAGTRYGYTIAQARHLQRALLPHLGEGEAPLIALLGELRSNPLHDR